MAENTESPRLSIGNGQLIQRFVHDIHYSTTAQTDQVMMNRDISVKPRHLMAHVDFLHQTALLQNA